MGVLDKFEQSIKQKFSVGYKTLIEQINGSFNTILQATIINAEELEKTIKEQLNAVKFDIFQENNDLSRTEDGFISEFKGVSEKINESETPRTGLICSNNSNINDCKIELSSRKTESQDRACDDSS